jgi:hypothetical protein
MGENSGFLHFMGIEWEYNGIYKPTIKTRVYSNMTKKWIYRYTAKSLIKRETHK